MVFKNLFKKKIKKESTSFRYETKTRQGDIEQYTDNLRNQVEHADLPIEILEKALEWLKSNPSTSSYSENYFIYHDKETSQDIEIAHFCGADEFARLLGALQQVIRKNS